MNVPSTLAHEILPLSHPGSEAPVSPRRKNRDPNWWNDPSPAQESLDDHFKAKKEVTDLKSNATTMAHASFIEEGDALNPAEETLSIDTCPSITQCEQAPKKLTDVPAEIQIAFVTVTNADESDEHEETTAAREYVPSSPTRRNWKLGQDETQPASPKRSNWKPDDFLPLARPASPVRKSRQAAKETGILDIDDSAGKTDKQEETSVVQKVATTTLAPVILTRTDDFLPLRSPPTSLMRKPREAAKGTFVVNTDENHAETEEKVETTVARSIATDIDGSATNYWNPSLKPDAFRPLRRFSDAASSASPSNDSKPQTEKASQEHTRLIDCFDTEALDCSGIDDATVGVEEEVEQTIRNEAVCAEELVEKQNRVDELHPSMSSLGHSSVEWEKPEWASEQHLKETGKAHRLKSEGNFAKPVTSSVAKGDGVKKEDQPAAVLKNKGATTTEKNIEWEKPDWTKCRELNATGKADVLNSAGSLARPISVPVGSDDRTETVTNIASEIRGRITQPFASRRKFC
jgi:hypothetical protein